MKMCIIIICFFVAIMIIIMFITAIPGAPSVTATTAGGRALWHVPGCSSTAGASVTWHEMTAELVAGLAFLMFQSLWLEGISMNLWWTEWLAVVWWFGDWVVGFATIPNMQVQIGPLMKTANIWLDWLFSYMNFHHRESKQHAVPNSQQDFFYDLFFIFSRLQNWSSPGFSTWTSEHRGCLDVTGAPLVAEALLPPELQKVLAALVEVDHWRSTSWSQVGGSYASNGIIWVPQYQNCRFDHGAAGEHIRATKAPRHLKICRLRTLVLPKSRNPTIHKTSWGNHGKASP